MTDSRANRVLYPEARTRSWHRLCYPLPQGSCTLVTAPPALWPKGWSPLETQILRTLDTSVSLELPSAGFSLPEN